MLVSLHVAKFDVVRKEKLHLQAAQGSMRAHQQDVEGAWDLLRRIATLWHSDHLTTVNFIQVDDTISAANVSEKL